MRESERVREREREREIPQLFCFVLFLFSRKKVFRFVKVRKILVFHKCSTITTREKITQRAELKAKKKGGEFFLFCLFVFTRL